ncbi:predicted protein [Aspergillus nidulans FGSC A4]|uniref:Methyltransferase domain-containing protein n=1 Tax=Emericella nidulans (strain FGSC A4 / ATCC 38163 / CBS 112.46 / NRRL 194 / M139) TaxID=227321 RepID=Q5B4A3_EMENI|nr:hypothetical protein [Aspergillus nidulans FGSC A4]EAA60429.1 predicted protein [Aspergillus nidulans FGSC A4]CBF77116.1 TPA: conserved hypothetical protein [Aspergillus nidulans FGSC A4]|eukprot:XP_662231.1 predicted protein [Aspergillus nidulans FGSC A4]
MHSAEHNTYRCSLLQSHSAAQLIYNVTKTLARRARILFIGCKSSLPLIHHLASAGHEIHGIDESKDAIALARRFPGDYHLISPVGYYPPFEFDAIFAIRSLHHLSHAQFWGQRFRFQHGQVFIDPGQLGVPLQDSRPFVPGQRSHNTGTAQRDGLVADPLLHELS